MKRIDKNKVRTMVEVVETYSESREFEEVTQMIEQALEKAED